MISLRTTASRVIAPVVTLLGLASLTFSIRAQSLDEPIQGFVSIEPYEVRQTFVVRLATLGLTPASPIQEQQRAGILENVLERLSGKCPLTLDGEQLSMEHERSEFIRSDPALSIVTDDREEIPQQDAVVALVFATSRPGFPTKAAVHWDLFPDGVAEVAVTFRSPGDKKTFTLTPGSPSAEWQLPATESLPQLEPLPSLPPLPRLSLPLLSILLGVTALGLALVARRLGERTPPAFGPLILGSGIAAVACWPIGRLEVLHPFEKPDPVTPEQADEITYALLINLYHAFDYRDEDSIYDTLAKSAHGDLLRRIYLEISKSLTLEDQGGAKVRIKNVDLRRCIPEPLGDDEAGGGGDARDPRAFHADCEWVAIGDVTHWAHTHTRLNQYTAQWTIAPVAGEWRMIGLENLFGESEVQQKEKPDDEAEPESAGRKAEGNEQSTAADP